MSYLMFSLFLFVKSRLLSVIVRDRDDPCLSVRTDYLLEPEQSKTRVKQWGWKLRLQCSCEHLDSYVLQRRKRQKKKRDIVNVRQFLLRLAFALTIS
jgi:hypothetical protein